MPARRRMRALVRHLIHSMVYGEAMTLLVADVCALLVIVNQLDGLCFMLITDCLKHLLRSCPAQHDIAIYGPSQLIALECRKAHTQSA